MDMYATDPERADDLNDRANFLFGKTLLGRTDTGDIAEMERSARALQDELCASTDSLYPTISIDTANLEAWEESRARDFDVTDDVPF